MCRFPGFSRSGAHSKDRDFFLSGNGIQTRSPEYQTEIPSVFRLAGFMAAFFMEAGAGFTGAFCDGERKMKQDLHSVS